MSYVHRVTKTKHYGIKSIPFWNSFSQQNIKLIVKGDQATMCHFQP